MRGATRGHAWVGAAVVACVGWVMATPASASLVLWSAGSGGNNHWYELVLDDAVGWIAARDAAIAKGGYLATITSEQEQLFIVNAFFTSTTLYGSYWIGLTDVETEGTFKWVTGDNVNFTNWGSGQPDNNSNDNFGGQSGEDYVQLVWRTNPTSPHPGGWNDAREQGYFGYTDGSDLVHLNRKGYIVEYNVHPVPVPAALPILAAALAGFGFAGYRHRRAQRRA